VARITLVVNEFDTGSETFLHALAKILAEDGHVVTEYSLSGSRQRHHKGPGRAVALPAAKDIGFPLAAAKLAAGSSRAAATALSRATARFGRNSRAARAALQAAPLLATQPDVVHISFSGIAITVADALELLDPQTKVIVSCRGSGELVSPVLHPERVDALQSVLNRADSVHAVSAAVEGALVAMGVRPELIRVIRPAVDIEKFSRTAPYPPISAGQPTRILSVGRLHWVKDVSTTLSALAELIASGHQAKLTIVGDGPEREALQYRAFALGIADSVVFTGPLPHEQVRQQLEQAQLFVLSSLSEGISNAALEAMALELPVIVTAVGGMPEVIEDGVTGWVVPPSDPAKLAESMIRAVTNSSLAEKLGRAGRASLAKGLTLEMQSSAIRQMYGKLL
jgi:glycosyltransferase involved in cell wall biosynthesis